MDVDLEHVLSIINRQDRWRTSALQKTLLNAFVMAPSEDQQLVSRLLAEKKSLAEIQQISGFGYDKIKAIESSLGNLAAYTLRPVDAKTAQVALKQAGAQRNKQPWVTVMDYLTSNDPDLTFDEVLARNGISPKQHARLRRLLTQTQKELRLILALR